MKKSTLLHLRIPFSFFLLPIFLFAWAVQPAGVVVSDFWIAFVLIHFLLYPASNAYNSYFDKDEESIGSLKNPPKVSLELYYYALLFDLIAILLGWWHFSWQFALMLFIYGLASKAYSHPSIRLKKYAYLSWFIAGFFQGYFTFLMTFMALHRMDINTIFEPFIQIPALLSTLMLMGSYPMTQIYQHSEDSKRGDQTLSLKLGILGTFHFTAIAFSIATIGFVVYFLQYHNLNAALLYLIFLIPILSYFAYWYLKTRKNRSYADFEHTMRLNLLSGLCLNLYFVVLGWLVG